MFFFSNILLFSQLASHILTSLMEDKKSSGPYASNWLERLRFMKRLQIKLKALDDNQETGLDSVLIRGGGGNVGHVPLATASRSRV